MVKIYHILIVGVFLVYAFEVICMSITYNGNTVLYTKHCFPVSHSVTSHGGWKPSTVKVIYTIEMSKYHE